MESGERLFLYFVRWYDGREDVAMARDQLEALELLAIPAPLGLLAVSAITPVTVSPAERDYDT